MYPVSRTHYIRERILGRWKGLNYGYNMVGKVDVARTCRVVEVEVVEVEVVVVVVEVVQVVGLQVARTRVGNGASRLTGE